jgi:transposase
LARPTLLTPELEHQLVSMLRAGNVIHVACSAVGIDQRSYQRWMKRGESDSPDDELYREFRRQVEQAHAEAEARAVTQVARAAAEDWRAAAWWLERQYPDRWGRPLPRVADEIAPLVDTDGVDELASKRLVRRQAAST